MSSSTSDEMEEMSDDEYMSSSNEAEAIRTQSAPAGAGACAIPISANKKNDRTYKFQVKWLKQGHKFAEWVVLAPDKTKARCKYCMKDMVCRPHVLERHAISSDHCSRIQSLGISQKLTDQPGTFNSASNLRKEDRFKSAQLQLAVFAACHTSVLCMDHLGLLVKSAFSEAATGRGLRLHRTKCSRLIDSVLAPALLQELVLDINASPGYSLIIDESTDISTEKKLALVVRYFSWKFDQLVCTFLGCVPLDDGCAVTVKNGIIHFLNKANINIPKLLGLGTDGASVLCGSRNSVFTKLRDEMNLPNLKLVKCVCHSVQLAASAATKLLPTSLEFMVRESYNWFSHSSNRVVQYKELHMRLTGACPRRLVALSDTRWLAFADAVERLLDMWDELKQFFEIQGSDQSEKCYTARVLGEMYADEFNLACVVGILPILEEFRQTNKLFQMTFGEPLKMFGNLQSLLKSLLTRIVHSTDMPSELDDLYDFEFEKYLRPPTDSDLGIVFAKYTRDRNWSTQFVQQVKHRCHGFIVEGCKQLKKRIPEHNSSLAFISNFAPAVILGASPPDIQATAFAFGDVTNKTLSSLERQLKGIRILSNQGQWRNVDNSVSFWQEVGKYENAALEKPFMEFAELGLKALSLPLSNADVERVFSQMNLVKTKIRNRMQHKMLTSILTIRFAVKLKGSCCFKFEPTEDMFNRFVSSMYNDDTVNLDDENAGMIDADIEFLV